MDSLSARQNSRAARQAAAGAPAYERPSQQHGGSEWIEVSGALNFASIAANTSSGDLTIAAPTGVTLRAGAPCVVSPPLTLNAGLVPHAFVTDGGASVTVRLSNVTAGALDAASGTFTVAVKR